MRRVGLSVGTYGEADQIRVEAVAPDGLAAGRIQVGDLLVAVNGKAVSSPATFNAAVLDGRNEDELRLTVEQRGRRGDVVIPLR